MVKNISNIVNMSIINIEKEIKNIRKVRGTFAHDLNPNLKNKYMHASNFIDTVISALFSDELRNSSQEKSAPSES
jgi:hypothetical protein